MDKTKIILDCDPGHDDAIAMLLAWGNPKIDLVAVTTVAGNQTVDKVTHNALAVARVGNMQGVTFAKGSRRPIVRPETENAPSMTITLVPTGALTNIALTARLEPRIVERVKEVVLIGGGYHTGNWSAVAEFNIKIDPEAAFVVFNEKRPVTMVGLDLTHQALATPEVVAKIKALGTKPAQFVCDLLDFFGKTYKKEQGFDYPPVHDPCAVAYVIDPTVMTTKKVPVTVELTGTYTLGMTVADFRQTEYPNCHTQVAVKLDHTKFWNLIIDALKNIGEVDF